jgi:alpha-1,2-mannosyltransferase
VPPVPSASAPPRRFAPALPGRLSDRGSALPARLVAVLGLLSVAGAVGLAVAAAARHQIDFDVYRMGAADVLGHHLYDARLPRSQMGGSLGLHFTYPPFAALAFWPFTLVSVGAGQLGWSLLNLLALMALAATSIRALRPAWSHRQILGLAAIVLLPALLLNPDLVTLDYGQVNYFIALLTLVDLTCVISVRSHRLPRGVLLGVAAAVKLTPLIFIPFLLLTRQFRAAGTAIAAFLACSLGAFALAPHSSWLYWSTEIFDAKRSGNLLYISDQNLHSALQRVLGGPPSPVLLGALTLLFAGAGLAAAAWAYRASSPMLGILLCAATGLIISPISWSHHYVWIVPILAWLVLGSDRPRGGWCWALILAILFWAAPIWWVPNRQQGYGGALVLLAGNSFFLAVVAFLILAVALLWARSRGSAPAQDADQPDNAA